jgi:hypothetical protein
MEEKEKKMICPEKILKEEIELEEKNEENIN